MSANICAIMPRMKTALIITIIATPAYFVGLAQFEEIAPSLISALAQAPLVIAFGWFVLQLAKMQEESHRETMRLLKELCRDYNPDEK